MSKKETEDSAEQISENNGQISKKEYDYARSQISRRKDKEKFYRNFSFLMIFIISCSIFYYLYEVDRISYSKNYSIAFYITVIIISGVLFFLLFYLFGLVYFDLYFSKFQRKIDLYELTNIQEEVEENIFESSLKMSYKYLDQYYAQTREQAKKGFLITTFVTLSGALLLFIGIASMYINKTNASTVTVASGVIVEFISAIMFYLYNRTVQSMGNYHDKLFLSQNISIALKISDSISSEKKDDIKSQIITELITDVNAYIVGSENKNESSKSTP